MKEEIFIYSKNHHLLYSRSSQKLLRIGEDDDICDYHFPNMKSALLYLVSSRERVAKIWSDSDLNHRYCWFRLRRIPLVIYFEGIGTFRRKHHKILTRGVLVELGSFFWYLVGFRDRRGGSLGFEGYLLPDYLKRFSFLYEGSKVDWIHLSFRANKEFYLKQKIYLVLGDWTGLPSMDRVDKNWAEVVIELPHPHQNSESRRRSFPMAEIVISSILKAGGEVCCIHTGSSSILPFIFNSHFTHIMIERLDVHNWNNSWGSRKLLLMFST